MKSIRSTLTLVVILSITATTVQAQNRAGFHYKLKDQRIIRSGWTLEWQPKGGAAVPMKVCSKKLDVMLGSAGEKIPVDVWQITDGKTLGTGCIDVTTPGNAGDDRLVLVHPARTDLSKATRPLRLGYSGLVFGGSAIAARVRFAVDSMPETGVAGFTFSVYGGQTWGQAYITPRRITHIGLTIGPFLGMSTTDMKKAAFKDKTAWKYDRTALTMCYGGNLILYRNNIGLVISYGYETVLGPQSKQWVYNWNPWLGIGLATSLGTFGS